MEPPLDTIDSSGELTHSQQQIWVGQSLHPDNPLYNMAFAFVFSTALRTNMFLEAWQRVADTSDALRTRLVQRDDGRTERALSGHGPQTKVLDFSQHSEPEREFRRWCQERCTRPLPLTGSLVDSVLVELGNERTGWYLNQHHLLTDAWSLQLLCREVTAEYEALLAGNVDERPPLPSYYETAAALPLTNEESEAMLAHWRAQHERPGRTVPLYGRSGKPVGTASERLTLQIDGDRSRALEELARQDGFRSLFEDLSRFTLFATLLVAWLHRVSGTRDLGFDTPVSGRPTASSKRALGLFIEMFPFAVSVDPGDTFRTLGARCLKETMRLLRHAQPGTSSPSGATASNVVLNYFSATFGTLAGLPVEAEWMHPGHGDSVHALRLQVHDFSGSGCYTLHFDGNVEALPERLRHRSLEHFEKILDACIADPDCPIASVDLRTDDDRRILTELNATDSAPLPERSVIAMFEAVRQT